MERGFGIERDFAGVEKSFESSLSYPHNRPEGLDVSDKVVDATRTGVLLQNPHELFTPKEMALQVFERIIKRSEYMDSPPGLRSKLGKDLQVFGCSEKETGEINAAIIKMDGDEKAIMIEGGEPGRYWRVEKLADGEYDIQVRIGNEDNEDASATESVPILPKELSNQDKAEDDQESLAYNPQDEMGLVLEQHADAALDVGNISDFQRERRDITDEEDPARRAANVLAQNSNSNPE